MQYRVPIKNKFEWQKAVLDKDLSTPPTSPSVGDRYIVASGATGDWSGHENDIAEWNGSSWEFTSPLEGMITYVKDEDKLYQYITSWGEFSSSSSIADRIEKTVTQNSHGFSVGDILSFNGTSYVKAKADSVSNAEVVGIVSSVVDSNNFKLVYSGYVSGLSGLTAGEVYFLSDSTAGALTSTEPTTEGSISKPVLLAISNTEGIFINFRGIEITDNTSYYGSFTNSDLSSGKLTITHNLGHKYCSVTIIDNNDKVIIPDDVTYSSTNSLEVDLTSYGTITGTWRYVVLDVGATSTSTPKKIQDEDGDTFLDTEETSDKDEIVGKVAGVEVLRIYSSGIVDLAKQSGCAGYLGTAQSVDSDIQTKVAFDTKEYDSQNEYDNTTNYRFTATKDGKYLITCKITFSDALNTTSRIFVSIYKNGSECKNSDVGGSSGTYQGPIISTVVHLTAGDYIEFYIFQQTGASKSLYNSSVYTYFSITKIQ